MESVVVDWALEHLKQKYAINFNFTWSCPNYNEYSRRVRDKTAGMTVFNRLETPAVQILHLGPRNAGHWVTTLKLNNEQGVLYFDSLGTKFVHPKLKEMISDCYGPEAVSTINIMACDTQLPWSNDCGYHSLANTIETLENRSTITTHYEHSAIIRQHLIDCIIRNELTAFPKRNQISFNNSH